MTRQSLLPRTMIGFLAVSMLAIAACGGSSSSGSKESFAADANRICRDRQADVDALGIPEDLAEIADLGAKNLAINESSLDELRALKAPKEHATKVKDLLAGIEERNQLISEVVAAAQDDDEAQVGKLAGQVARDQASFDALAREIGLTDCAKAEAEAGGELDLAELATKAEALLLEIFEADGDLDYTALAERSAGGVQARFRNQELLGLIDDLHPSLIAQKADFQFMTSNLELEAPVDGLVRTTGRVTADFEDAEGAFELIFDQVVFELDGADLRLADWRRDGTELPNSAGFLVPGDRSATAQDVTVHLEPGFRAPEMSTPVVEYLFTVDNHSRAATIDVNDVVFTAADGTVHAIQFGVANTAAKGGTAVARVGFEGPSLPVFGGEMTIELFAEHEETFAVTLEVPPFLDADGRPERARPIVLADTEFTTSGSLLDKIGAGAVDVSSGVPAEITDATAFRDSLLELARANHDAADQAGAWGIPARWDDAVPGLRVAGYAVTASPSTVSGFSLVASDDGSVLVLPFAVSDTSGTCAGGVVLGTEAGPLDYEPVDLSGAATCNAQAVIDVLGL